MGQTKEEIQTLKSTIEKETRLSVAVLDVANDGDLSAYPQVVKILDSFSTGALPVITLDGEIVSMGTSAPGDVALAFKDKTNGVKK